MEHLLVNLFVNAVQAMGEKGNFWISIHQDGQEDVLIIRDSGPGIPPELRKTLFDPLTTDKIHGTGLGLAICQQIVQRHGGTINLLEEEAKGAAFAIRLPTPADRPKPSIKDLP